MVSDLDGFRNPGAANSFLTSPNVRSLLEKRGVERYQDDASVLKWREMPSMAAARAYGPIELAAASYTGEHADCLGAYELQEEMVEGRPTYRQKTGLRWDLSYATNCNWMIGPDTSKPAALWTVASEAKTPDAITEQWSVCDGGDGWDPVVVVVTSGQATAAVAATAAMEDDAAVGEDGGMQGGGGGGGGAEDDAMEGGCGRRSRLLPPFVARTTDMVLSGVSCQIGGTSSLSLQQALAHGGKKRHMKAAQVHRLPHGT